MKVAIIGAGSSGVTLYSLLKKKKDVVVDIYGKKSANMCGMRSCAWGVNSNKFQEICNRLGLDYRKYCMRQLDTYYMCGLKRHCKSTMIDKALLLKDLAGDNVIYALPNLENYDRVIDATGKGNGKSRATYQIKAVSRQPLTISLGLLPVLHCKWVFPLADGIAHIGVMTFNGHLAGIEEKLESYKPICKCYSHIRTGGLDGELVKDNMWKVGESAGVVDPITGSGILLAMISAMLLYENWDDGEKYKRALRAKFGYMNNKLEALFHNEFRGVPIKIV